MKKILFILFARMGDVCCGIPSYLALRKKFPDARIYWLTLGKYAELVPDRDSFVWIPNEGEFGRVPDFTLGLDQILVLQPMWRHDEWKASGLHAIDLIAKWCDVALDSRKIEVAIPESAVQAVSAFPLPERFVTIGCSPPASSRNLLPEYFPAIVDYLKSRKIPYVTVGGENGVTLPGAISLHGCLTPVQTIDLVSRSAVYVGPDTGTTWLACAAEKTEKVCILDTERLLNGIVGFEGYIDGKTTHDLYFQSGVKSVIEAIGRYWDASLIQKEEPAP